MVDKEKDTTVVKVEVNRDFFSSIILLCVSTAVGIKALNMPRPGGWSDSPGLIPLFLASCIFIMSLFLLISSIRHKAIESIFKKIKSLRLRKWRDINEKSRRSFIIIGLTVFYIIALVGRIPFEFASFIYLAATFKMFWKKVKFVKLILISFFVPFFISMVFRGIFIVLVPGGSLANWILTIIK